jgi:3-hydroxyisobutyrate dehydrogenase-like beta-hydroxyacid dehydrogenase
MPDNDSRSRPRLGFIGLGGMGGRMAARLLIRTAQQMAGLAEGVAETEVAA